MSLIRPEFVDAYIKFIDNRKFLICRFQDKLHDKRSPVHYRIFVPIKHDAYVLLCLITSKVKKKLNYYKRNRKLLDCLIKINKIDLPFLRCESIIDCNQVELMTREMLKNRIVRHEIFEMIYKDDEIPVSIKQDIIKAINSSPMVSDRIKRMLLV